MIAVRGWEKEADIAVGVKPRCLQTRAPRENMALNSVLSVAFTISSYEFTAIISDNGLLDGSSNRQGVAYGLLQSGDR